MANDALWSQVLFCLNATGADGSSTLADASSKANTISRQGATLPTISTAWSLWGAGSLRLVRSSTQHIRSVIGSGSAFPLSGSFTIEGKFNLATAGIYQLLFSTVTSDGYNRVQVFIGDDNKVYIKNSAWGGSYYGSSVTVSAGTPFDIAYTYDSTTTVSNLWLNGALVATKTAAIDYAPSTGWFKVGTDSSAVNMLDGYVQSVRVTAAVRYTSTYTPSPVAYPVTAPIVISADETLSISTDATLSALQNYFNWIEAFSVGSAATATYAHLLVESLLLSGMSAASTVYSFRDAISLAATPSRKVAVNYTASDGTMFSDALQYIAAALAADGFDLADTSSSNRKALLDVAETLALASGSSNTLEIAISIAELLSLREVIAHVSQLTANETVELADALSSQIRAWLTQDETLTLTATTRPTLVFLCADSLILDDFVAPSARVLLNAKDTFAFIANLPLEDGDYSACVMNADTVAVSEYTNFQFNSIVNHEGQIYGISDVGLYELEGDSDDGANIDAWIATGDLDFGTSREKNCPRAYLYITQSDQMLLKTITSRHGVRSETYYEIAARDATDDDGLRRVQLGRGVRGVWWRYEIHNVAGGDFNLQGAEVLPVVLSRRG